ncbi:hypothetical protein D3C87_1849050 [compost metagenome]
MADFKTGDVVRLKSDDVPMTVESFDQDMDLVHCVWHDGEKKLHERAFLPSTLILVSDDLTDAVK